MTFTALLAAMFTAALPLFLLAFALVSLALRRGWLQGQTVQELQGSLEALGKAQKDKKHPQRVDDPALGQWFRFGGGFYGLVALYTWLLIEWDEVLDFLGGLSHVVLTFDPGALIGLVIELFIESIMNFVMAIGWPAYWLSESRDAWLLLFFAYGGYWLGIKAARYAFQRGWVDAAVERILSELRSRF
ncbi:MAG: hypothetical protein V2I66_15985, partial [Halieaceae bacterium]|jgi:hypothetical protein|nr:hypothetical protein [Halieaceae bacterium]